MVHFGIRDWLQWLVLLEKTKVLIYFEKQDATMQEILSRFQNLDANYNQLNCICLVARNERRGEESKGERGREKKKKKRTICNFSYFVWNGIIFSSLIYFLHVSSFPLLSSPLFPFLQTTVLKFSIVIIYAPPSKVPASSSTSTTDNKLPACFWVMVSEDW